MSLEDIRPYFRARLLTVAPTLKEWTGAIDVAATKNVPNTIIQNRYHIEIGTFKEASHSPERVEMTGTITVKMWLQKGQEPQKAVDAIVAKGEALIKDSLRASNRVTQPGIKNIQVASFRPVSFDPTNDNLIELGIDFSLTIYISLPKGDT